MSQLSERDESVSRHYDDSLFEFESVRLPQYCPVEYAITVRQLNRWVPDGSLVAEIGVGGGYYCCCVTKSFNFLGNSMV